MKLIQIQKNGKPSLGILTEQGVIDVHAEAALKGITMPADMNEVIAGGKPALDLLEKFAKRAECFIDPDAVALAPVITGTDRIFCIGLNYRQHAAECNLPLPPARCCSTSSATLWPPTKRKSPSCPITRSMIMRQNWWL